MFELPNGIPVPLVQWEDGTIRLEGRRLLLDMIVLSYRNGETPETIVESFPTATLTEVYAIIAYYLAHREFVDAYLQKQQAEGAAIRAKIEAMQGKQPTREELLARLALKVGDVT